MIIGNPFQIAIWIDVVPEWSSLEVEFGCFARDPAGRVVSDNNRWVEGILMLIIDGRYLNGRFMQTTTLCVESAHFANVGRALETEVDLVNGRTKTELFNSAHIPRYVGYDDDEDIPAEDVEAILQTIRDHGWSAYKDIKYEGLEITPQQIGDYGWTVYHFVDHEEEVLVYKQTDSEEIYEKRMPLGTTRAVFLEAAEKMKIFDAPL
jgi:hypothetical protein